MITTTSYLIGGLVSLYLGAEGLVRGSASLSLRLGLTRLVIGLTIVAFGTSSPEMVVSVKAAFDGNGAISLGNVIGSNICNIALILGLAALVSPIQVNAQVVRVQVPILIVVSLAFVVTLIDGRLERLEGAGLFTGALAYTWLGIHLAKKENREVETEESDDSLQTGRHKPWLDGLLILVGLGMLVLGAELFVSGAVDFAQYLGISQAVIGLTIVSVGTSLPELATSMVAAVRKEGDIAVGNIVGSNIFNILAILGIASLIQPIQMDGIKGADLTMMMIIAILTLPMVRSGFLLSRLEGAVLLAVYSGYLYYLIPS